METLEKKITTLDAKGNSVVPSDDEINQHLKEMSDQGWTLETMVPHHVKYSISFIWNRIAIEISSKDHNNSIPFHTCGNLDCVGYDEES